ncbi:hypothetical protein PG984_004061 [Apiospora sp. TS-2023a]
MRASLFAFSAWLPHAVAVMNFIAPPRYGSMHDYTSNVEYPIGYDLQISWTPGVAGRKASLELYQVNLTSGSIFFGKGETITEGMIDLTAWKWQISTSKDLSLSNVFQLAIWDESKESYDDWCHYFNITGGNGSDTSSKPSGAAVPTATTPPNRPTDGPPTEAATSTSGAEQKKDWTGMSTGAKITMAVIIPIVAIAGFAVGWCVLGRQRRRRLAAAAPANINSQWQPIPPKDGAQPEQWPQQDQWQQHQQGAWTPQGQWQQHASWQPPHEQWQQQEQWKHQQQPEQLPPQELPSTHDRHQIDDSPRETAHELPNAALYELPSATHR